MARKRARKRASATPAQDRLTALLRERGEVRRRDALRVVSASTVARAAAAGKVVRIVRGRAVFLAAVRTAPVVRMPARRPAPEGVPGGRLAAMTALLSGAGRTAGERAADFFFLGG